MKFISNGTPIWSLDNNEKPQKVKADGKTRRCQHILDWQRAPYKPTRQCEYTAGFDRKTHCKTHSKDFIHVKEEKRLLRELAYIKDQLKSHRAKGA